MYDLCIVLSFFVCVCVIVCVRVFCAEGKTRGAHQRRTDRWLSKHLERKKITVLHIHYGNTLKCA